MTISGCSLWRRAWSWTAAALVMSVHGALAQQAPDLALKRVLLSTGGVGYFEHETEVEGDASLTLDLRLDQINDALKSLVVIDSAGGVGNVRLPGRAPLAQIFRDLPFDQSALASPQALLAALAGAEISIQGQRSLTGRVVAVVPETVVLPEQGGVVTRHRVSLMTAEGMRSFLLEDAEAVTFVEPELQDQIARALAAIAEHRVQDRRALTIEAPGQGRRLVRVGYVAPAPLWKTSYRLNIGDDGARLQGWGIFENMTGRDWRGVELTLSSGNPVTFRQALYSAYYVDRPEVPVEVFGRLLPPPDTGAMPESKAIGGAAGLARAGKGADLDSRYSSDELLRAELLGMGLVGENEAAYAEAPAVMADIAQSATAVAREQAATQVIFRIDQPLDLAAGESALVPVIDRDVPAERVSLYQPAVHGRHPLAAVRLTNDTGTGLPPGVLTLFDRDSGGRLVYVGDSRLEPIPAGDSRFLTFALDQAVTVDQDIRATSRQAAATIAKGLLRMSLRESRRTVYRIEGAADDKRRLVIEHPRQPGWDLVEPDPKQAELTESAYRLVVDLEPGEVKEVVALLERPLVQTIAIVDLDFAAMQAYAESSELPAAVRAAFVELARLRAQVETRRIERDQLTQQRDALFADQERLRENLTRVPVNSDIHNRYLAKLDDQESALEALATRLVAAEQSLRAAEEQLATAINNLEV